MSITVLERPKCKSPEADPTLHLFHLHEPSSRPALTTSTMRSCGLPCPRVRVPPLRPPRARHTTMEHGEGPLKSQLAARGGGTECAKRTAVDHSALPPADSARARRLENRQHSYVRIGHSCQITAIAASLKLCSTVARTVRQLDLPEPCVVESKHPHVGTIPARPLVITSDVLM